MRCMFLLVAAAVITFSNSGCLLNIYSSDPNRRVHQLLNTSKNARDRI